MSKVPPLRVPSLCDPTQNVLVLHDHPFVPSGARKRFGCAVAPRWQPACQTDGWHEACARCGWPADEHGRPAP